MWFRYLTSIWTCLDKYFDFMSRASRKEYWSFTILTWVIWIFFYIFCLKNNINLLNPSSMDLFNILSSDFITITLYIILLLTFIPSEAVAFRRAHDIGYSGGIYFLFLTWLPSFVGGFIGGFIKGFLYGNIHEYYGNTFISLIAILTVISTRLYFFTENSQPGENKWGANPKGIEK